VKSHVRKDLGSDAVLPHVCFEAQRLIGLDRVFTLVLKSVGSYLM
jgi:hypothetical protein